MPMMCDTSCDLSSKGQMSVIRSSNL